MGEGSTEGKEGRGSQVAEGWTGEGTSVGNLFHFETVVGHRAAPYMFITMASDGASGSEGENSAT